MAMLVAGIDVSGNPQTGNYKFMGVVIGVKENLDALIRDLQLHELPSSTIKNTSKRSDLASKLRFNRRENIGLCIRIDKDDIVDSKKKKVKTSKHRALYSRYNQLLFQFLSAELRTFTAQHGVEWTEINFQCDADCQGFIADNNLRSCEKESVHTLADLVAWSNNREKEPEGAIRKDARDWIKKRMKV